MRGLCAFVAPRENGDNYYAFSSHDWGEWEQIGEEKWERFCSRCKRRAIRHTEPKESK